MLGNGKQKSILNDSQYDIDIQKSCDLNLLKYYEYYKKQSNRIDFIKVKTNIGTCMNFTLVPV